VFRVHVPQSCDGVPAEVLQPRNTWSDKAAYDHAANELAGRFEKNFVQFAAIVDSRVREAGPVRKD
jgi:phosphoenolpyruvate carboxykinase (ATP)